MKHLGLVVAILALAVPASALGPTNYGDGPEAFVATPGVGHQVYDAALLRPLGFVQVVVGAVAFVLAYPVSLLVGGDEDVLRACIEEPAQRTFRRPLGRL